MSNNQRTIENEIRCSGVGIHSGDIIHMSIMPADVNTGIVFVRSDLSCNNVIPALFNYVVDTTMCTAIANESGVSVLTIEHLMSALWGCGIDNAIIQVSGKEVPIMDGSSSFFVELLQSQKIVEQLAQRKIVKITDIIHVMHGDKSITLEPSTSFSVDFTIDFADSCIGKQSYVFTENQDFGDNISKARTFGFVEELDYLTQNGLAKGASLENAVAVGKDGVLNEEGLRYTDEFVRHKVLDCIGDLYLAGARIEGKVKAVQSGHALNNLLLKKLFSTQGAYITKA